MGFTPLFEDMLISCDLHQLNKKPTRHMVGQKSSLLDLFLSNIPQRISNLENILNTTSKHEGVKCLIGLNSSIRQCRTFIQRDYRSCNFNVMQPLVDKSIKLQS